MFELLFNYPLALWREATLVFDSGWPVVGLLVAIGLASMVIVLTLWRRTLSVTRRALVAFLQTLVAAVLLIMIWKPALLVSTTERGENTVAWVIDSSASMQRQDAEPPASSIGSPTVQSRFDAAVQVLQGAALDEQSDFDVTLQVLGDELSPVDSVEAVKNHGFTARSNLAPGLERLLGSVSDTALAAVVLISDGADNSDTVDARWWQMLSAAGVPVHTVGVGLGADPTDLELADVHVPERVQPDSPVSARLHIRHSGAASVRVRVSAADELLAAQDLELPAGVEQSVHVIRFASGEQGISQLEFSIEATRNTAGVSDPYPENNRQARVVQVVDTPKRILYVEGEPRWEYKFLRRALEDHPGVNVVSLLRTSPNKFYRQGVSDASELSNGFPDTREQLFVYDAIIIGSFEAAELTTPQQSALRDFVSERGGSLLMLGGRQGLADGGWGRSVLSAALPVALSNRLSTDTFKRDRANVMPTLSGTRTPWLQLSDEAVNNADAWQGLPALADAQDVGQPKPGALTLLERQSTDLGGSPAPLLVMQRYGRGQSVVLGTSGTWRWQMSLPSTDQRHERFWRQLLGALVEDSVPRLAVKASKAVYRDSNSAELTVSAFNADYSRLQLASLPVSVTTPLGTVNTVEFYPHKQNPGVFVGHVDLSSDGPYSISITTPPSGESPSVPAVQSEHWWVRESGNAESFSAHLHDAFLRRISETTGGSYLALDEIEQLQTILSKENAALKRESRLPLWNMPFFFLCLLLAKALEWWLRLRWKRL